MLFLRNEPTDLVQTKGLAFRNAENELVFECKRTPIKPKKWAKKLPFVGQRTGICESKGGNRWASTRGATRAWNLTSPGIRNPPGAEPRSGAGDRSRQMQRSVRRAALVTAEILCCAKGRTPQQGRRGGCALFPSQAAGPSPNIGMSLNWVAIGHNFPLCGLGGVANATSSSLATRVLAICLLSLQNGQGLRLRNATQTNPALTIGWQENCLPEHPWGLSKREIWPCGSVLQAAGIQE
jgi:hypothetical protein